MFVAKVFVNNLEKHHTKDTRDQHINGSLTVVWRDYDEIIKNAPKMVYVSSINPGEIKGPHLHTKRNSYFVCIHGSVVFIIENEDGSHQEIVSSAEEPALVFVPKNVSSAHVNPTGKVARVLALADLAWRPNDDEMKNVIFHNYDWQKWKNTKLE